MSKPQTDLLYRKLIGRSHVNANRIDKAISIYKSILREYPHDLEAYMFLGDCHLASSDYDTALKIFRKALESAPNNEMILGRIELALAEIGNLPPELENDIEYTLSEEIIESLDVTQISEEAVENAANVLSDILESEEPAQMISERLDELEVLLPAILELNIQQANTQGNTELARELTLLRDSISGDGEGENAAHGQNPASSTPASPKSAPRQARVLFLTPEERVVPIQIKDIALELSFHGFQTTLSQEVNMQQIESSDVVVFSNPHSDRGLMRGMAACMTLNIPMLVYLHTDFEHLPITHPDYISYGLATPDNTKAHQMALKLANRIIVPNQEIAERLSSSGYPVQHIPVGWSTKNPFWNQRIPMRQTINIGWIGSASSMEDILPYRRAIYRVLNEFPQTKLVICDNPKVYYFFDSLPPNRVEFLPTVDETEFPYQLSNIDILLVPQRNTPFNQTRSDMAFVAAGVKQIPWLANALPHVKAWEEGGIISENKEDWHTNLRQLVMDRDIRKQLGEAGYKKSQSRKIQSLVTSWAEMLHDVIQNKADGVMVNELDLAPSYPAQSENNLSETQPSLKL